MLKFTCTQEKRKLKSQREYHFTLSHLAETNKPTIPSIAGNVKQVGVYNETTAFEDSMALMGNTEAAHCLRSRNSASSTTLYRDALANQHLVKSMFIACNDKSVGNKPYMDQ